jgi:cyanophycinase
MKSFESFIVILLTLILLWSGCQFEEQPQSAEESSNSFQISQTGGLFVIGGGNRSDHLIKELIKFSEVEIGDTILILPWASSEPDTAFEYIRSQLSDYCSNVFSLSLQDAADEQWNLDDLLKAELIYITGGDQSRFLDSIDGTKIPFWLREAFQTGVDFAGTSAGAALMSQVMITGDQNIREDYESTYRQIRAGNGVYREGLGFVNNVVIDQHFVARSRYNRLLSALHDHPGYYGFGIDESTALCIKGRNLNVVGDSQVVIFYPSESTTDTIGNIGYENLKLSVLLPGDSMIISDLKW